MRPLCLGGRISASAENLNTRTLSLSVASLLLSIDQVTKHIIRKTFHQGETINVFSGFALTRIENTGAIFGWFQGANLWLAVISTAIIVVIITGLFSLGKRSHSPVFSTGIGLILGGAIGNSIDRIVQGHVTDFLLFYWKQYHWPAFNMADSAVLVGVILVSISSLRQ